MLLPTNYEEVSAQLLRCCLMAIAFGSASSVHSVAAEISLIDTDSTLKVILVEGDIEEGDYLRFMSIARDVRHGGVLLSSPGGSLKEGLDIGRVIRERGYSTGVLSGTMCASSCGLIWLAGAERYMAPSALIGFHAAYTATESGARETGLGNALVGAYLTELELPIEAVMFSTVAGPDEINWLTIADARKVGIEVSMLEDEAPEQPRPVQEEAATEPEQPEASSMPLALPDGYRWIVIGSSVDPNSLLVNKARNTFGVAAVTVVRSESGYYGVALGPFTEDDAEARIERLKDAGTVPQDAYLSSGTKFIARID